MATTPSTDVSQEPPRRRLPLLPASAWQALSLIATLALLMPGGAARTVSAAQSAELGLHPRVATTLLESPPGTDPSEPHLAVDPANQDRLFAVAQTVVPENFTQELLWRTGDGGKTWTRSPLLGGIANTPEGIAGDPVVAAAGKGLVLYGTLTFDFDAAAGTATEHVGTRVSSDGGASFTAFGSADQSTLPLCFFSNSCPPPPPPDAVFLDKPWLAVDATDGRFQGSAYLVWVRARFADGRHELLLSFSRDQGRTYAPPILLDQSTDAELAGLEELAQVAVRPDGTVDVVWNGVRQGRPLILHAVSKNGGATFSTPERVVSLRPQASRLGIVTSLAVSDRGRLGLCWSQAQSPDGHDARVACKVTDRRGTWGPKQEILPQNAERQYLPAATFQRERLWVAAYISSATSTRLVAVRREGGDDDGFGDPITVNSWPIPGNRICAPHPPDCREGQTFIGDYIGLVATQRQVVAAYIEPSADPSQRNRVLVSSLR